jgi:hypothetical protein
MAFFATGTVLRLLPLRSDLVRAEVDVDGEEMEAFGFPAMLGAVAEGDEVVLNVTGVRLGLGTGDAGFILWNLGGPLPAGAGEGHIMKLRYSPWQLNVCAVEEQGSRHHDALREVTAIPGVPVVACGLHSQVPAVAAGIKAARPRARVGYLMSDGGALPLAWSDLAARMREQGLVDVTCTYGHAFGGDLEAVNVFSGLAALAVATRVDAIVASLGPGVVGTGTSLGFSALEQGQMLDAAGALGARAVACLRLSFADARPRHRGVSHHTLTSLTLAAQRRCLVAVPRLGEALAARVTEQLAAAGVDERHELREADGAPALGLLRARDVRPTSMGRSVDDSPELWLAAGAAGAIAAEHL